MVGFHLAESVRHPAGPDRSVEFPPRRRHLHRPAWRPAYFRFHRGATFLSATLMGTVAGPWGSLVYPWRFGTFRPRFKSGRTHFDSALPSIKYGLGLRAGVQRPLMEKIAGEIALSDEPGRTLRKWREDIGVTVKELSRQMG